ncbi:YeeC-like protein [Erythrobacter sp. NAP1]|uniref:GIY-YIG nuclease family protein n=1 Tax=Erythrobacter sp. NAP1 TaxID=237727 RepID=UPI0000686F76|nr:GIY-YIG nuclease family protein [Erythrobacter sp. NAP1]EAQ29768.1 YeeC-like protein [Erythrobacter sp. NAP1]
MANFTQEDDDLLEELGVEVEAKKVATRTPLEERIIAGFEEIQRFVEEHGKRPQHGEDNDIFERLYAVRLERIRDQEECRSLVEPMDHQGLLDTTNVEQPVEVDELDDDALLAELGVEAETADITELRHVRSSAEKRAAEEIANRDKCEDFEKFQPLFEKVQREIKDGIRQTRPFVKDAGFLKADIKQGELFILGGQTVYVAEVGETIKAPNGETDARLRVIYSNGTESNLLLRSLQRALYKDEAGRRITEPVAGPLFTDNEDDDDQASGTIYVLRSKSDHPTVAAHREVLHKIGVTSGKVERRIANAKIDPTFLMADVEIVATYELFNINRTKLESVIHRVFGAAKLDIEIKDRFGKPVVPKEWFLVPRFVIDEAVARIKDGTITEFVYDPTSASLKEKTGRT